MTAPVFNISARKVGGIRFLKVGRLNLSMSVSRAAKPAPVASPDRWHVRPVITLRSGLTLAGLRVYRNGKFCALRWLETGFEMPGAAWAHAEMAAGQFNRAQTAKRAA